MNFPKTLIFLIALHLTVATEFACAQTPAVPTARIPASTPAVAAASVAPPAHPNVAATAPAEDIRDIHGPISIPYEWLWAAYVAGGLALAGALYAGWRWYRRHAAERAKLPHELALERLDKARRDLMAPEHAREYSFAVSEITRRYIEARFHERAARRTTQEFLHDLLAQSEGPLAEHREQLEDFLHHCDLAKFARWQLSLPEMESMHESARAFVVETCPQPRAAKTTSTPGRNGASGHLPEPQLTNSRL